MVEGIYDPRVTITDDDDDDQCCGAAATTLTQMKELPKTRWTFYGTLVSTVNVSAETMEKITDLEEFIYNRKKSGEVVFYARFTRGRIFETEWFVDTMQQHGINVDPASIPEPSTQSPAQHVYTRGRVARHQPVDFAWQTSRLLVKKKSYVPAPPQQSSAVDYTRMPLRDCEDHRAAAGEHPGADGERDRWLQCV